jgi:O-antigen/teichoic acid export membrane protein
MLLRHTLLYLPAQVIGPLAQFVAAIVWTHWISPDGYGILTFVMAGQDFVFLVCLSWWSQYTLRYFGGLSGDASVPYRDSEASLLAATAILQIIATLALLVFVRVDISLLLVLGAIAFTVTRSLTNHLGERARTKSRILAYTFAQTAGPVVGFAVAYFIVSRFSPTPEGALIGFAIPQAVALASLWLVLGVRLRFRVPDQRLVSHALAFGLPVVFAGIAGWVGLNAIRFIVNTVEGAAAMGLIAAGWGLGQRLTGTVAMFVTAAAFPLAIKSLHSGARDVAYRQLLLGGLLLFGLVLPTAVGLWLLAEPLVMLAIAEPFRDTTMMVLPFAAGAGAARNIRVHIADQLFLLVEKPRIALMIGVAEALVVTVSCFIGLELFGLGGAAAGCFVGSTFITLFGFSLAHHLAGLRVPYADASRLIAATLAMASALLIVPWARLDIGLVPRLSVEVVFGLVVYAAAVLLLFPALARSARRGFQRFPAQ